MAICYKLSYITYGIAKFLLRIKYIGLPNILLNKSLVVELWQHKVNEKNVAHEVLRLLEAPNEVEHMMEGYKKIQDSIGEPGASKRAARAISTIIGER
jgi:lipid-A-disaccharide synthase